MGEFLQIYQEQLDLVAHDGENPSSVEALAARQRAALVWQFDRATSNGAFLRQALSDHPELRRRETFAEVDVQRRLWRACLDGVAQCDEFLEMTRAQVRHLRLVEEAG